MDLVKGLSLFAGIASTVLWFGTTILFRLRRRLRHGTWGIVGVAACALGAGVAAARTVNWNLHPSPDPSDWGFFIVGFLVVLDVYRLAVDLRAFGRTLASLRSHCLADGRENGRASALRFWRWAYCRPFAQSPWRSPNPGCGFFCSLGRCLSLEMATRA